MFVPLLFGIVLKAAKLSTSWRHRIWLLLALFCSLHLEPVPLGHPFPEFEPLVKNRDPWFGSPVCPPLPSMFSNAWNPPRLKDSFWLQTFGAVAQPKWRSDLLQRSLWSPSDPGGASSTIDPSEDPDNPYATKSDVE